MVGAIERVRSFSPSSPPLFFLFLFFSRITRFDEKHRLRFYVFAFAFGPQNAQPPFRAAAINFISIQLATVNRLADKLQHVYIYIYINLHINIYKGEGRERDLDCAVYR